jgi:hypothetical protein
MLELCLWPVEWTRSAFNWSQLPSSDTEPFARNAIAYIGEGTVSGVHFAPLAPAARRPTRESSGVRGHKPRQIRIYLEREPVQSGVARRRVS